MLPKHSLLNHVIRARDFLLDLVFPIDCLGCGQEDEYLCDNCQKQIKINKGFSCPACKKVNTNGSYCPTCQKDNHLDGLWISADYSDPLIKNSIKKIKYNFVKELIPPLAQTITLYLKQNLSKEQKKLLESSIIIPVPLHKKRLAYRGFNQSELIGKEVAKKLKLETNTQDLTRQSATKPQAKLKKIERIKNVQNAFMWRGEKLNKKNIILIDDVSSTESTLGNCAKVLKQAGAKEVWGLVIAKN